MLDKIINYLKAKTGPATLAPRKGTASTEQIHIAVAVLLLEMASRDNDLDPAEAEAIIQTMGVHFGISRPEVPGLVDAALEARASAKKIDEFVQIVNESYTEKQRTTLLAVLWKIVVADGHVDDFERKFAVQMRYRFKLSEEAMDRARRMAERGEV